MVVSELAISGPLVCELEVQDRARSLDAELVEQALSGNQSAFQSLVEKYRPLALRTAYGFFRNQELSRDVAQEAFVRVYKGLGRFDTSRSFATWLRRITVNLSIDELRRRRRRAEVALDDGMVGEGASDPVAEAQTAEHRQAVWDILEQLPLKYRTVMLLREIEGLPTEEVAKIVRRPQVTVRWRLHQARKLFRDLWVKRFGEMQL